MPVEKDDTEKGEEKTATDQTFNMNEAVISYKSMKSDMRVHSADLIHGTKTIVAQSEARERGDKQEDNFLANKNVHFRRKTHLNLVGFQKPNSSPLNPQTLIQEMQERNDLIRSIMNC